MNTRGFAKHTVLIVDDEPALRDLWKRILSDEGYRVAVAGDAFDAVGLLATNRPTVAICDMHLPGPTGAWLVDMIRLHCPRTAVVLASGDPVAPQCESLRDTVVAYMAKPIRREQLLNAVKIGITWASEPTTNPC